MVGILAQLVYNQVADYRGIMEVSRSIFAFPGKNESVV